MEGCHFDSAEQYPDYVHEDREATSIVCIGYHFTAERPQGKHADLEELDSERDTYDGKTEQESYYEIT